MRIVAGFGQGHRNDDPGPQPQTLARPGQIIFSTHASSVGQEFTRPKAACEEPAAAPFLTVDAAPYIAAGPRRGSQDTAVNRIGSGIGSFAIRLAGSNLAGIKSMTFEHDHAPLGAIIPSKAPKK